MMGENRGQISLEYMLIFAIALILLMVFTFPIAELTVKNTLDISDTLKVKSDLCELSHAIEQVYSQGQGSKQTVYIDSPGDIRIDIDARGVSCNFKLKDNSKKLIKVNHESNLEKSSVSLKKGMNAVVVQWPENNDVMEICEE